MASSLAFAELVGYAAGVLTVGSYVPQVIHAWRTRRTRDLSFGTVALLTTSAAVWMTYGALIDSVPVIVTNAGMFSLTAALVVAKVRFTDRE